MLSVKENERLTRIGPGTPMGALLRRYWHPVAATAALDENPVKTGQAPYSQLMDQIEAQWANTPSAAD